jgi:RND family efflux transporter MFP subunit
MLQRLFFPLLCLTTASLFAGGGCAQGEAQSPVRKPPEVTVAHPAQASLIDYHEFTGETQAVEEVDIRARVQGFLQKIYFTEGTEVQEGDLLYQIDPRTFQAEVDRALAEVARLKAQVALARSEERRAERLRSSSAVSEEEYVQRVATRQQAEASLKESEAAVELAKLNLSFTEIRAPISGRIGRTLYTEGNLVGTNEPTLLTNIVRLDPIYVVFTATERALIEYQHRVQREGAPIANERTIPVFVSLETEEDYPHRGILDFRENKVDPTTGTIKLRGVLPNRNRLMVPGMFARVRVPVGEPRTRLLAPQAAVGSDQRGDYVVVVGSDNIAQERVVKLGRRVEDMIVVTEGLKADDLIVVNGIQKARQGSEVSPTRITLTPPETSDNPAEQEAQPATTQPTTEPALAEPPEPRTAPASPAPTNRSAPPPSSPRSESPSR